jgi:pectinesterase
MPWSQFAGAAGLFAALITACPAVRADVTVTAQNDLDAARPSETVVLRWAEVSAALPGVRPDRVVVTGPDGKHVVAQPVWLQPDKKKPADEFVFQADFAPRQAKSFTLAKGDPAPYEPAVYGRWVPERHDDFAWESDRIAFRVYGPELEIVEPGSAGIDVWPKRTRGLVVNKWYQLAQSINDGYYHFDHGEGMDGYKVGHGQGCGGTAFLVDGKRVTTGIHGWKTQRVLANGPVRLVFELTYPPVDVHGVGVRETKRVTLDAGHNLNGFESTFTADGPVDDLRVMSGIGEHQDRTFVNHFQKDQGWMTYWDPCDAPGERTPPRGTAPAGYIGTAVVMPAAQVSDAMEIDHQMELITKATPGQPVRYWAGAGWDRSGDFGSYDDWNKYVAGCAARVGSPVKVTIGK